MTDAELIDMLRNNVGVSEAACKAAKAAADRIEQLVAEKDAATAAAYEVAAKVAKDGNFCFAFQMEKHIRALATPDQTAALDRLIAEAEARTVERIAELVSGWRNTTPMTGEECANAILYASKKGGV